MAPLYRVIAQRLQAIANCEASDNAEWAERHTDVVEALVREHMPSGSGFDCGTKLDFDRSTLERLVFASEYHHHGEQGYTGWTQFRVTVRPSLMYEVELTISGRDRNGFKEYAYEVFRNAILTQVTDR